MLDKKFLLFVFGIIALLMAMPSFAITNLTNCHEVLDYGLNVLQNDVLFDSDLYGANGYCFAIAGSTTLDCQGHTIDMNASENNAIYVPFESGGNTITISTIKIRIK